MDDDVAPEPTAFLSHASEDKASFAEPLGRELASLGIRPWLDKWEIRPGDSLVTKLFDEGVSAVDAVIVMVSQYSAGKPWVRAELDAAAVRRITENTRLIPIRLDGADMPAPLQSLVWHDAARTEDGIRQAARLIADTIHGRDARPAVAPPPAYARTVHVPGLTAAAGGEQAVNITVAVAGPHRGPVAARGGGSGLRGVRGSGRRWRGGCCGQVLAVPGDRFLHGFAQVLPQMPAVSDLDRIGRAAGAAVGVTAGPVPADQLRARMALPGGERVS